jgi:hypothetical protein
VVSDHRQASFQAVFRQPSARFGAVISIELRIPCLNREKRAWAPLSACWT